MRPLTFTRLIINCFYLAVILFVVMVIALKLGAVPVSLYGLAADLLKVLFHRTSALSSNYDLIVIDIRLHRRRHAQRGAQGVVGQGPGAEVDRILLQRLQRRIAWRNSDAGRSALHCNTCCDCGDIHARRRICRCSRNDRCGLFSRPP